MRYEETLVNEIRDITAKDRVRSFKDLVVWQEAMKLAKAVYGLVAKLPKDEQYGLSSQMRRAATSVPSNIAEGQSRGHRAEYRQFLHIALGSLSELETQLLLTKELGLIDSIQEVLDKLMHVRFMLLKLVKSL
jgi:four helix bundle protein